MSLAIRRVRPPDPGSGAPSPRHASSARLATSCGGAPVLAAAKATSSNSGLARPLITFIRMTMPSTVTCPSARATGQRCTAVARTPMVPVIRWISRRCVSTRVTSVSTWRTWPGRPFFIVTGLTHASSAPDCSAVDTARPSCSPVTSSRFVSSSKACWPGPTAGRSARRPMTTWVQLGRSCISPAPPPNPDAATVISGMGPKPLDSAASRAAPVGVVSSMETSRPYEGMPSSSRRVAGAGLGSRPCALRTMPMPVATEEAHTSSTPRTSSAAAVPTTSMMASCPPTSWKWT